MAMSRKIAILLLLFFLISISNATLSKSGNKERKEEKKVAKVVKQSLNQEANFDDDLRTSILETHKQFDNSESNRKIVKLGYVTPWNGWGYDVAKWTAQKYTHISPVWFQLVPAMIDGELSCEFKGQHDIDRGWLEDLRKNNSDIKIVPRFLFEPTDSELFQQFITADSGQLRCAEALSAFLLRNQFEGCVFEYWLQILVATRGAAIDYLIEMTELFGKRLHIKDLLFIVPMTPPLKDIQQTDKIFLPEHIIPRLMDAVDYLNLMTYDFAGEDGEGNAPIEWVINNVHLFTLNNPKYASKVVIGLNYYGNCKGRASNAILGHQFIELLQDSSYELLWNENSQENYIQSQTTTCFFPTLRSIEVRLLLVDHEGLGGVGIWELGQGLNHFTSLL